EPIQARPTPFWERAWKWVKRRPARSALLAVSTVSAIAFILTGIWTNARLRVERNKADESFRQARQMVDDCFVAVSDSQELKEKPELQPLRRELMRRALQYHKQFVEQSSADPQLRADVAKSYLSIAEIYFYKWPLRRLSENNEAAEAARDALAFYEELARDN